MRTPLGVRTAVGFTSARRLTGALGARQPYIRLAEPCLRALAEPLGVGLVTVDPQLAAPPADRTAPPADRRSLRERCQRSPKRTVYEAAG